MLFDTCAHIATSRIFPNPLQESRACFCLTSFVRCQVKSGTVSTGLIDIFFQGFAPVFQLEWVGML